MRQAASSGSKTLGRHRSDRIKGSELRAKISTEKPTVKPKVIVKPAK